MIAERQRQEAGSRQEEGGSPSQLTDGETALVIAEGVRSVQKPRMRQGYGGTGLV